MRPQALIIDDEPDILDLLLMTLESMEIDCRTAENITQAHQALEEQLFDICLTDMKLPDGDGIDLVRTIQKKYPQTPVAVITAHGSMQLAVDALKAGAFDFVSKPVKLNVLRNLVNTALKLSRNIDGEAKERRSRDKLLGDTQIIKDVRGKITKLARSQAPVYISGESGTGKELVARLIHDLGARSEFHFIPVNCGAIPAELVESELFGHKKGSFTGATSDKDGLFQAANGGTLFLDEIAELPLPMQVKLLRVLQEKTVRPVGGREEITVDVRVLSATHRDLAAQVQQGKFREDLFYRVNVIELNVPPLRERQADISLLAEHIMKKLADSNGVTVPRLTADALRALEAYSFPGNVRELENILERAITWADGGMIQAADLSLPEIKKVLSPLTPDNPIQTEAVDQPSGQNEVRMNNGTRDLSAELEAQEREIITQALEETRWNKTAAAKKLGITFRALRYRLKKLGLE